MQNSRILLKQLIDGSMLFNDFLDMEQELAESMQQCRYTKPILHEETPLAILCMNLYQAIKAANRKNTATVQISSFFNNPLCEHWLAKATKALENGS